MLELGCVEKLIIWSELQIIRYEIRQNNQIRILYLTQDSEIENGEILNSMLLTEWFANNYSNYGSTLEFISDSTQESSQYINGFGGVGGILRYKVDINEDNIDLDDNNDSFMY